MSWSIPFFAWFISAAIRSFCVLIAGTLVSLCIREPVRRIRVIELTCWGCLLSPWLGLIPGYPAFRDPLRQWGMKLSAFSGQQSAEDLLITSEPDPSGGTTQSESMGVFARVNPQPIRDDSDDIEKTALKSELLVGSEPTQPSPHSPIESLEVANEEVTAVSRSKNEAPVRSMASRTERESEAMPLLPVVASSTHPEQAPRIGIDFRNWIVIGYLSGVGVMSLWWGLGIIGLRRVLRRALPADEHCREIFEEITGAKGKQVKLLVSDWIHHPFTARDVHPVIVVPMRLTSPENARQLTWCLAHEWSHVAQGDLWRWQLAGIVRVLFFYQPLAWLLRRHLQLCQDYLADAAAARRSESPEDYAQFLVDSVAKFSGRSIAALGIDGQRSTLSRRILMLVQNPRPLVNRCSRIWNCAAVAVAALVVAVIAAPRGASDDVALAQDAKPRAELGTVDTPATDQSLSQPESIAVTPAQSSPQDPGNAAIWLALGKPLARELDLKQLDRFAASLEEALGVEVQLDRQALEEDAIAPQGKLELLADIHAGITVQSALERFLEPLQLTYVVQNEALLITTLTAAQSIRTTRIYDVTDLVLTLREPGHKDDDEALALPEQPEGRGPANFGALMLVVNKNTGGPNIGEWQEDGGDGTITPTAIGGARALVVRQTQAVHGQIATLLTDLRAAREAKGKGVQIDVLRAMSQDEADCFRYRWQTTMKIRTVEGRIRKVLEHRLSREVKRGSALLTDFVPLLKQAIGGDVDFGWNALREDALDLNQCFVSSSLRAGVTLRSALDRVLGPQQLTWVIKNEALVITTMTNAQTIRDARVYDVSDILVQSAAVPQNPGVGGGLFQIADGAKVQSPGEEKSPGVGNGASGARRFGGLRGATEQKGPSFTPLIRLIQSSTGGPNIGEWQEDGGEGTMLPFVGKGLQVLVVRQTQAVHEQIEALFADLRRLPRTETDGR